jgi:hypothetical protein
LLFLDPGWVKVRIRDKHPGSATLLEDDATEINTWEKKIEIAYLTKFTFIS